jgi:hypothetical protein
MYARDDCLEKIGKIFGRQRETIRFAGRRAEERPLAALSSRYQYPAGQSAM